MVVFCIECPYFFISFYGHIFILFVLLSFFSFIIKNPFEIFLNLLIMVIEFLPEHIVNTVIVQSM